MSIVADYTVDAPGYRAVTALEPGDEIEYLTGVGFTEASLSITVARDLPNLTRQTLMNIHKDPQRRRWYLQTEADDEHVDVALESIRSEVS